MEDFKRYFGWIDDPIEFRSMQKKEGFENLSFYKKIKDTGKGQISLLHLIYENVTNAPFPVWQQGIGDCVSFGYALAINTLMAVQIAQGEKERIPADVATEPIYGGSRVEVGQGRLGCRTDGKADGSHGVWAAKWVMDYGVLLRQKYDCHNLSIYDGNKARSWGCNGVPNILQPIAKEHTVKKVALVQSYEEARDALVNGYPIAVCSSRGFESKRDDEGFARPMGTWNHCMCFIAVDDRHERPGLLCCNSWGPNWISGPKRHNQPNGSFWVDADVADKMLNYGDSYALSSFDGFESHNMVAMMSAMNIL